MVELDRWSVLQAEVQKTKGSQEELYLADFGVTDEVIGVLVPKDFARWPVSSQLSSSSFETRLKNSQLTVSGSSTF